MAKTVRPRDVLDFWFKAGDGKWFVKDPEFDAEIARNFGEFVVLARKDGLGEWETSPEGSLGAIIVFDQFPRNLYRGEARTFASDLHAVDIAGRAIERGFDTEMPASVRSWFYMPFMHAEDLVLQERCVALCQRPEIDKLTLDSAIEHADIIRRFGRFPHRNVVLGRRSTDEEKRFLDDGGFSG